MEQFLCATFSHDLDDLFTSMFANELLLSLDLKDNNTQIYVRECLIFWEFCHTLMRERPEKARSTVNSYKTAKTRLKLETTTPN
jgi:hypothetical protein